VKAPVAGNYLDLLEMIAPVEKGEISLGYTIARVISGWSERSNVILRFE
jgi:hypothetical protein